mgnify:CR=1 FL=1
MRLRTFLLTLVIVDDVAAATVIAFVYSAELQPEALGITVGLLVVMAVLRAIGVQRPANLGIVVIDNERYGETGMQATHTAAGVDLAGVAKACGLSVCAWEEIRRSPGPAFAVAKVAAEKIPIVLPPREGALLKARFRRALLGPDADSI